MPGDDLELRLAWQQHVGRSPAAERWFESLLARHREPSRHYHGTRHVRWVVRHAIALGAHAADVGAVVAAGFFHDAVYDVARHDNEAASARLAVTALREIGWDRGRTERVAALIEATGDHRSSGGDSDVLLAADLAVLASDPARYGDYVRAARREYAHLDDATWRTGRAAVLERLLAREHLYAPRLGLDTWERRARANLAAELASLRP